MTGPALTDAVRENRRHIWLSAAKAGDVTFMGELLEQDAKLVADCGDEAFAAACGAGHLAAAQWLCAQGVPATSRQHENTLAAAENGHWRVVEWLMDQGTAMLLPWFPLKILVPEEPALFARMLKQTPYISAIRRAPAQRMQGELLLAQALTDAMEKISAQDNQAFAAILLDAGLDASALYEQQIRANGFKILRHLYVSGYRPTADQQARHNAAMVLEMSSLHISMVRALTKAWEQVALVKPIEAGRREAFVALMQELPAAQVQNTPVVLLLAQAGHFGDIAHLLPRHGAALLLARAHSGLSPADILASRGELHGVFTAEIWQGHEAEAKALWQALPAHLRAQVDYSQLAVSLRRSQLDRPDRKRFKLGKGGFK